MGYSIIKEYPYVQDSASNKRDDLSISKRADDHDLHVLAFPQKSSNLLKFLLF